MHSADLPSVGRDRLPWTGSGGMFAECPHCLLSAYLSADCLYVLLMRVCEEWLSRFSHGVFDQASDVHLQQPPSLTKQSAAIFAQSRRQLLAWRICISNG